MKSQKSALFGVIGVVTPKVGFFAWFYLLFCALFLGLWGHTALAGDLAIGVGGNVHNTPYKNYDTQWVPLPIISYESDLFYIRSFTAGVKVVNLKFVEVSVFGGYDPTSFDSGSTSDQRLRRLDNRYPSAEAGMEARLMSSYGMIYANAARDVLDNSDGWRGSFGYRKSFDVGAVSLMPALGVYWATSDYNEYYYGISAKEARNTGLPVYNAGSGVSPYLGLTASYEFNESWDIFCSGEVVFLSRAIKDSPMVDRSTTQSFTTGIMYNF